MRDARMSADLLWMVIALVAALAVFLGAFAARH